MKFIVLIGIIVGISLVTVFVVGEIIWYYANEEFEAARDEFKSSLTGISELEDPTSSYMDKIVPTLDDFRNTLNESQDIDMIFSKFGEPHDDIGSGIHIYVYKLNDSTQVWIGYTDKILYVNHVDSNGNVLEQLF